MTDPNQSVPGGQTPPGTLVTNARKLPIGEYIFGAASVALGIYVIIAANFVRVPVSSNTLGPKAFPFLVGASLVLLGIVVLVEVTRGKLGEAEEGEDVEAGAKTDWLIVIKLIALLIGHTLLIRVIGWPLSAALLFAGSAWVLGAKRWWMASLIGLGLGVVIQFLFGRLLGLSLPVGPLLDWIPFL